MVQLVLFFFPNPAFSCLLLSPSIILQSSSFNFLLFLLSFLACFLWLFGMSELVMFGNDASYVLSTHVVRQPVPFFLETLLLYIRIEGKSPLHPPSSILRSLTQYDLHAGGLENPELLFEPAPDHEVKLLCKQIDNGISSCTFFDLSLHPSPSFSLSLSLWSLLSRN